jgi:hypothetical protein
MQVPKEEPETLASNLSYVLDAPFRRVCAGIFMESNLYAIIP